jgi:hypothetical protein
MLTNPVLGALGVVRDVEFGGHDTIVEARRSEQA